MNARRAIAFGLVVLLGSLGCQPQHVKPREREPQTEAERNFQTLWRSSRRVLKKYGFELDRQDRRAGVITTFAATSGHLFEVWRRDAATPFHYQENAVQNILRAVRLSVRRGEGDTFDFNVEVLMARSNLPQPMITDASEMLGRQMPSLPRLRFDDLRRRSPKEPRLDPEIMADVPLERNRIRRSIVPLGRDTDLEMRLTRDIRSTTEVYDIVNEADITPP